MLNIKGLSFSYQDGPLIFRNLNLEIGENKRVLIIAPPNSGKTTLSKILTGSALYYDKGHLEGSVEFDGKDLNELDIPERMGYVARTSQNTDEMLVFSTLFDDLEFESESLALDEREKNERKARALSLFGMEDFLETPFSEESGGEKKRAGLCEIFFISPKLYVLDEPFDDLSIYWRERLKEAILNENASFLVLGSHYLGVYDGLFDEIWRLDNGELFKYSKEPLPAYIEDIKSECSHTLRCENLFLKRNGRDGKSGFSLDVPHFEIKSGDKVVLMGENGSGKSTLSKVICGLIKNAKGSVELDGVSLDNKERRRSISYIMQNPFENLYMPTVLDELKTVFQGKIGKREEERIESVSKLFSLNLEDEVYKLSYGKAKMLQVAIFYLLDRDFVIFDEIDNALTYDESLRCIRLFLERGDGILVITHDEVFSTLVNGASLLIEDGRLK